MSSAEDPAASAIRVKVGLRLKGMGSRWGEGSRWVWNSAREGVNAASAVGVRVWF